ncbi:MAG: hypothetical protein NTZ63_02780 [Candidatus Omnitrophica bacterium]|nr:hypothetical protein [Candidatus Omnitrophota bacterium]
MKKIIVVFALVVSLVTSGCATFPGNQLPKQAVKLQIMKEACLVSENVYFDELTANIFPTPQTPNMGTPIEYFAPYLRQVIVDARGSFISVFQEAVDARMAIFNALSNHEKRVLICGSARYTKEKIGGVVRESVSYEDLTGDMPIEKVVALYKSWVVAAESTVLANKMRSDIKFREEILASGDVWFDCKTSVVEGNSSTCFLEGLLCVLSGSIIPAHHRKDINVKISIYTINGKIHEYEYRDSYNSIVWLLFLPIGLVQNPVRIINSVINNMAITALLDYQKDQGKE